MADENILFKKISSYTSKKRGGKDGSKMFSADFILNKGKEGSHAAAPPNGLNHVPVPYPVPVPVYIVPDNYGPGPDYGDPRFDRGFGFENPARGRQSGTFGSWLDQLVGNPYNPVQKVVYIVGDGVSGARYRSCPRHHPRPCPRRHLGGTQYGPSEEARGHDNGRGYFEKGAYGGAPYGGYHDDEVDDNAEEVADEPDDSNESEIVSRDRFKDFYVVGGNRPRNPWGPASLAQRNPLEPPYKFVYVQPDRYRGYGSTNRFRKKKRIRTGLGGNVDVDSIDVGRSRKEGAKVQLPVGKIGTSGELTDADIALLRMLRKTMLDVNRQE